MSYTISERFKNLERSTDWVSDQELRDSIQEHGCVYPLVIWKEEGVLVDGHRRNAICQELGLVPVLVYKSFDSEESAVEWAKSQQGHRRNLTPEEITERRHKIVADVTTQQRGPREPLQQVVGHKAVERATGIKPATAKRDLKRERLKQSLPEDLRPIAESMTVKQVAEAALVPEEHREQHVRKIANPQAEDEHAAKFDAVLSLLSAASRALKAVEEIDDMKEFYTTGVATRVKLHISDARGVLNQMRPEVHKRCGGIGCELCNQRGWTTKANNERKQ